MFQVDALDASNLMDTDLSKDESELSILPTNELSYEKLNQHELSFPESDLESRGVKKLDSMFADPLEKKRHINCEQTSGSIICMKESQLLVESSVMIRNSMHHLN